MKILNFVVRSPYYRVSPSPWPPLVAFCLVNMAIGLVSWMYRVNYSINIILVGGLLLVSCLYLWWRDVLREGDQGYHSKYVIKTYRDGMIMFIVSEVMFFFSFFWAFFHSSLSPNVEVGGNWPPCGIRSPNAFSIPLLNTWVLVTSGISVNYAHNSLKCRDYDYGSIIGMIFTIVCGIFFVKLQYMEYFSNSFCISDSVYGSVFYMLTGFHGAHVIFGTLFLMVTLGRLWFGHFLLNRRFGFEACVWYWHFVDVIWIAVYIFVYVWGGGQLFDLWYKYWEG
uniref:cytochrome c oxidase subunit III n=1 Tax=Mytilisepta virgata TaxID=2547956 RepID=UPI0022A67906|nr:cytochrome c oxidase subunit III [Mytilisepta virgata]UZT27173.1 cytochrome c oxidase subunit 3 [Mytilisepta virgata]